MSRCSILALDIATRCGFAIGPARAIPRSGTVVLKRPGEQRDVAFFNFGFWLRDRLGDAKPALIVTEAPFHLGAFAKRGNSEDAVMLTYGLHAVLGEVAYGFRIPVHAVAASTVRKHFIGSGRMGDRKATKAAVIGRARLLGLIPKDCADDNRADACAIHDWAASTLGGKRDRELHLFGEVAR
jgi:hypothetical protein